MDRCVLLNWYIDCFIHWERNCTWYQSKHIYKHRQWTNSATHRIKLHLLVRLNCYERDIKVPIFIRTLISRTVPFSVYTIVNEPIQQHTAVHYNSWLRWTAMILSLQQTATHFYSSDVQRPFRSQGQFVCCGCFLCAFSWVYICKYIQIYRFVVNRYTYRFVDNSAILSIDGSLHILICS